MAKKPQIKTPDFRMEAKADGAEIFIYDDIGPEWAGMIGAKTVRDALKGIAKDAPLSVRINSNGGDVFEGVAIYNQLARHEGKVTVDIDGSALSAASIIAMAGDEIRIAENAMMMIHDPWGFAMGGAGDMRSTADLLDKITASLATTYAARTGKPAEDVAALMGAETWFDAKEAVEAKFADTVTPAKGETKPQASLKFNPKNLPMRFAASFSKPFNGIDESPACAEPPKAKSNGVIKMTHDQFKAFAAEHPDATAGFIDQGKKLGAVDARAEMKTFLAAFPTNPTFAAEQFAAGRTLDEAKATAAEIAKATAAKDAEIKAKDAEIEKLKAEAGTQGALAIGAKATDDTTTADTPKPASMTEALLVANAEWDKNPKVRDGFTSKDNYAYWRAADLMKRKAE